MKTIGQLLLVACVAVMLGACGGGNDTNKGGDGCSGGDGGGSAGSSPKSALDTLAKGMEAQDVDAIVAAFWTTEEQAKKMKEEIGEFKEIWDAGGHVLLDYKEEDIKVDGDKAEVKTQLKIKESADGEEFTDGETYQLEKRDGTWKCVPRN